MRKNPHFATGLSKAFVYARIVLHVAARYALRPSLFKRSPAAFGRFLWRAWRLLLIFRHNKVVRVSNGHKLHLYLPAYPSPAFFYALESKLLRQPPGAATVVFSMTKACPYKCAHCYQSRDGGPDLDEDLLLTTARDVQDAGVAMFDIEGGEPLVRFPRLLKLVQSIDERSEIWVNTTGSCPRAQGSLRDVLEKLRNAGLFGLMVSIHSPDPAKHDALTGVPGSFEVACDALKACREAGLAAAFNSVLSEEEIRRDGLEKLMRLARELDCDYVQLIHPKPAGNWMGRETSMQRDPRLIADIRERHLYYNSCAAHDYPSLAAQAFEESESVLGCSAGAVDRFYVNATGEVQPCEFLNISFGNVREESFSEIYRRMRSHFRIPCCDWLCCTQGQAIHDLFRKRGPERTPLPWSLTRELVETWDRGRPTPAYKALGIYQ
ncbi:MAG TPA: radical SAM protein [Sumerlaeia bacterium]|nr:radical SAM protein [Sumerlaeia bacterium]